jgi:spoIIIJ-associated protein
MDESQLQRGQKWLEKLLELASLPATVGTDSEQMEQEGSYWLVIDSAPLTSEQVETLIGADGAVLDAVQYLANTTLNLGQPEGQQCAYTVELNGYRARRQAELQAMAEQAAVKVRETGEEFEMVALSSAERRQVHTFLKSFEDLETYSRGREPDCRLVVRRLQG